MSSRDRDRYTIIRGVIADRYLALVLRLAKLRPEWVESYTGPVDLRARVEEEPLPTAPALRAQVAELLPDATPWIQEELEGIDVALRTVEGEELSYPELVELCHGVRPQLEPEETFAEAHRRLGEALPGDGDVKVRYRAWLETQIVPREAIERGFLALAHELRERTRDAFGLPAGEGFELELASDVPWAGFALYDGALRTRISVNTDLPIPSWRLLELVSHEVYPGHHTEHVWKDRYPEFAAVVYPTPQALVAEGIAQVGLEALLGDEAEEVGAACLRPLGIPYDVEGAAAVREAKSALRSLAQNILLLGLGEDEARAYARRWLLEDDRFVDKAVESIFAQPWRPYMSCYPEGIRLARRFVDGDRARFRRLLRGLVTPADLEASSASD